MMQMTLATMFLVAIAMMACGPSALPTESGSSTNSAQPEESDPALLLDEKSAISILQTFLHECLLGWDAVYSPNQIPTSEQEKKSWLMDLATGTSGEFDWSASYHGVTEVPDTANRITGTTTEAETWLVIGPGLERAGSQLVVPGRWKVYAGYRRAYYLDASARLAYEEFNEWKNRGRSSCYR